MIKREKVISFAVGTLMFVLGIGVLLMMRFQIIEEDYIAGIAAYILTLGGLVTVCITAPWRAN